MLVHFECLPSSSLSMCGPLQVGKQIDSERRRPTGRILAAALGPARVPFFMCLRRQTANGAFASASKSTRWAGEAIETSSMIISQTEAALSRWKHLRDSVTSYQAWKCHNDA